MLRRQRTSEPAPAPAGNWDFRHRTALRAPGRRCPGAPAPLSPRTEQRCAGSRERRCRNRPGSSPGTCPQCRCPPPPTRIEEDAWPACTVGRGIGLCVHGFGEDARPRPKRGTTAAMRGNGAMQAGVPVPSFRDPVRRESPFSTRAASRKPCETPLRHSGRPHATGPVRRRERQLVVEREHSALVAGGLEPVGSGRPVPAA